jgi:HTH-type transcriptional regulator/antitoxin HigA
MDVRPIRTHTDYQDALREIELLFSAPPNTPECDRLDVLSTLVEAYEESHFPIELPDPIEAIQYYMDTRGWSAQDLEACFGSWAAEVLSRRHSLTLDMIRVLHQELGVPAEILIQPYEAVRVSA